MQAEINNYIQAIEEDLQKCCDEYFHQDSLVSQATKYSLLNGGKRTRGILIFLTAQMCNADWKDYIRLASCVEMVHCYSLIHDDLPCMDNDDFRRGKLSCHKKFDEATALLAGDALLGCSIEALSNISNFSDKSIVFASREFLKAIGPKGMIYGQELDIKYENIKADKEILNNIHRNKTGRLISLCGTLGSLGLNLSCEEKTSLDMFFDNIGLVFQIIDDVLDVEGNSQELGKPIGSDTDKNKSTFVSLYGLENAKSIAEDLNNQGIDAIMSTFKEKSKDLVEYTQYLLKRKK